MDPLPADHQVQVLADSAVLVFRLGALACRVFSLNVGTVAAVQAFLTQRLKTTIN